MTSASDAWFLEDAGLFRATDVIEHGYDYFGDCPEYKRVLCPVCGHKNNHLGSKPQTIDGKDNYEAGWGGRGDLAVIPIDGECGHVWEMCLGFHKGDVVVFVRAGLSNNLESKVAEREEQV
jgi:hypothetical protein